MACGVVEKEKTFAQLSAGSSKAITEAFTEVLSNEVVEQEGEPNNADLATFSAKDFQNALTSAVIESSRHCPRSRYTSSPARLVTESSSNSCSKWAYLGGKGSAAKPGPYPRSAESSKSSTSSQSRKVSLSFEAKSTRQTDHAIAIDASRRPGDRNGSE
jgi:hypothetical protein